ncbi:hypothetical protein Q7C36_023108 [Tachysurus vachellii]|uniref:Uncharacterized protein n=1 Tax=Tachysurus vachellii TaxID=175792 RepID=A0AA88LG64_TACVA|nr:hypothetical protein Q7C36_023108 [Tachysurus vachellii]
MQKIWKRRGERRTERNGQKETDEDEEERQSGEVYTCAYGRLVQGDSLSLRMLAAGEEQRLGYYQSDFDFDSDSDSSEYDSAFDSASHPNLDSDFDTDSDYFDSDSAHYEFDSNFASDFNSEFNPDSSESET